ncbi:MAG TPA: GNAT family N-acetyltransferase [Candidatus Limnocylindrales bacterium]|jgi:RimJ/RimL family protein N-acetyltransferase
MADTTRRQYRLRGEHVHLRPLEIGDVERLHEWGRDGEYARFTGEPPRTLEQRRRRHEKLEEAADTVVQFAICRLDDDQMVGHGSLFDIDRINGSAALGIAIGPAFWSRGYGTDAVNAIVDFGFGELRLERIWLGTAADNERGQRAYRRAGFTEEVRQRRAYVDRGAHIDEILMSILRAEWTALPRRRSWDYLEGG